ncbi:MAG: acyltransferase family protein [Isosphaeraceae bacterium]|nr:acyltransferase family protein [Isosphaeraceae bacterium]
MIIDSSRRGGVAGGGSAQHITYPPSRFFALDGVRATAMLLGVVYHSLLFRMFAGGPPPGPPGNGDVSRYVQDWLHSFRMPLFFLISGFFGRMMLEKYALGEYLRRRWIRIGVPMLVCMFTFGPAYVLTREVTMGRPGGGPPGPMGARGSNAMPPPLPGFVPPGGGAAGRFAPPPGPGFRPGGPPPGPFGPPGGALSARLFGSSARYFQLNHLWFLWYLLLFVTAAPWVARVLGWILLRPTPEAADRAGLWLVRAGLAPVVLGLVGAPALMLTWSPFGWSLGLPPAIFRAFPDFLLHLDPDMAFFFVFFLAGWWLHRQRAGLPSIASVWLPNLILGLAAFADAMRLGDFYGSRPETPGLGMIRVEGYVLYSLGSALTGFALLGFFQRYLDRPGRVGRYLADTALWVYLVHQPLVLVGLALARPWRLAWWSQTVLVSAFAVAVALLLYELLVRPTPLVRLFGPAGFRPRPRPAELGPSWLSPAPEPRNQRSTSVG